MSIIAIFTGSRNWTNREAVVQAFDHAEQVGIWYVVTGDQRGLDRIAYEVARERKHHVVPVHAWWNEDGRVAGTIRNFQMVDVACGLACAISPNNFAAFIHGYAFPTADSIGTWRCVDNLAAQKISVDILGTTPRPKR